MSTIETIFLSQIEGFARRTGVERDGTRWIEFEIDSFAEQEPGECALCGKEICFGWFCLDGGDEVCNVHIEAAD